MPPKPITYNDELERLLKENSEECESLSILHRMSYEKYNKRSNYINIPVIILSSAIGFITGIDLQYDQMNIILGVGSVFVGIIKSNSFSKFLPSSIFPSLLVPRPIV